MSGNVTLGQSLKEVIFAIEFGHLNIGITYFIESMGITAGAFGDAILSAKARALAELLEENSS